MRIQIDPIESAPVTVALLLLFRPQRMAGVGRELQKARWDFTGMFRR